MCAGCKDYTSAPGQRCSDCKSLSHVLFGRAPQSLPFLLLHQWSIPKYDKQKCELTISNR